MNYIKKNLNIDKWSETKIQKILFCISMIFYSLIGILLTYNFDFSNNYNLLFDSDTGRVIGDMTNIGFDHYRLSVHPLFVMLTQPIYFLIQGLVLNKMLALVLISSFVSSLSAVFIYKILSLFSDNKKTKTIISLCYIFAFSNFIFTAGIEIYNIASLFLIILWYYALKKIKTSNFSFSSYIIFITLGVLSIAFTITNFCIFIIILFMLWISKKISIQNVLIIAIMSVALFINFNHLQNLIWHNTPTLGFNSHLVSSESEYSDYNINFEKVTNVIENDFYNSIIGNDVYLKNSNYRNYDGQNFIITFGNMNIINLIIISSFYILFFILIIRNYKKNLFINIGITLAILFNTILHTLYGNDSTFLYSLHFLYLIFIGFGINLLSEDNKKLKKISLIIISVLLFLEIIINSTIFIKVLRITETVLNSNYILANVGLLKIFTYTIILILLISILIYYGIKFAKKILQAKEHDKKIALGIGLVVMSLCLQYIFVSLEATYESHILFLKKLGNKTGEVSDIDRSKYIRETLISQKFKNEISALNTYIDEYEEFLNKHNTEKVSFLKNSNYYFFGFGNRRKLLYKHSCLIDIESGEKLYTFNEKEVKVIPNIYTVIIETKNGDLIKIYEDETGVHYSENGTETIINGTNIKMSLYDFHNQKYQNIKKVLYGEILFNIKDSTIYPNILVYDKPWYRDAALTSMVLKQTNNTDLISDWVDNINELYDKQNKGNEEADNLGELLYILSTQDNINYNLVNKIEAEAKRIAKNNSKGYYLNGTTDFSDMNLYQNLWYKLGIEAVGRDFKFNIANLGDSYSSMAWWSDNTFTNHELYTANTNYPYLSLASYHKLKLGQIAVNSKIYPLSWEKDASEANYKKMKVLDKYFVNNKISPLHTWTASEMLLLLLDETNDLTIFNK